MPKRYVLCTPLSKTHGDWVQCVDPSCMDGGEEELRSMIIHVGFERIRAAEDREPTPQNVADRSARRDEASPRAAPRRRRDAVHLHLAGAGAHWLPRRGRGAAPEDASRPPGLRRRRHAPDHRAGHRDQRRRAPLLRDSGGRLSYERGVRRRGPLPERLGRVGLGRRIGGDDALVG